MVLETRALWAREVEVSFVTIQNVSIETRDFTVKK